MATVDSPSDLFAEDDERHAATRGWWILFVSLVFQFSVDSTVQDWISARLATPEFRIGHDPPFYFIHEDVIRGISAAAAIGVVFTFTIFTWSYSRLYSHMAQWMTLLWMAPHVARAIDIWIRCENLFTEQATGPWPTFDSYLDDPRSWIVFYGTMILSVIYSVRGNWLFRGEGNSLVPKL